VHVAAAAPPPTEEGNHDDKDGRGGAADAPAGGGRKRGGGHCGRLSSAGLRCSGARDGGCFEPCSQLLSLARGGSAGGTPALVVARFRRAPADRGACR